VLLILGDITAVKRTAQMRADFIANAGHELKTPLAALIGFIETLLGPARDDAAAREFSAEPGPRVLARAAARPGLGA
jgi:two-component system phosphate regulon sensor histidine kinase PhoR